MSFEEEGEEAFGILRGGIEVDLWDLTVVKWRSEGELKEEGVLRWRREVARVKFMVGGDTGRILKRDGFRGWAFEQRRRLLAEGFRLLADF